MAGAPTISANVVGDQSGYGGMKATAEGYMRALECIGVRVNAIDAMSVAAVIDSPSSFPATAAINLICCEIAAHFAVRSRLGEDFFRDRYNIGVWLWELTRFPKEWCDRFVYYDEIWAPTSYVASTLSPLSPTPVVHLPFVLEPKTPGDRSRGRTKLGMAGSDFLYLFVFNFHSRFQRKNPMAVIEAFKKSFKPNESARLIIKCANADFSSEHFRKLNRSAEGHRITIHDGHWSEQEISDLTAACDCYVSLHRAEGVGVTISDAMAAGKPVVATGWSGNMDFMNVSNSFPVRYRLIELDENVAYYRAGNLWAEPSIEHAAEMLRYVFEHRDEAARRGEVAREHIRSAYSADAIGALIARRLAVVSKRCQFQSLKKALANRNATADHFLDEFRDLGEYFPEHQLRYQHLKKQLGDVVHSVVPSSATLLVVSRGDDDLLSLHGRRAWHFPLESNHQYAGRHPKDSAEAIDHLEAVRAQGAEFLLFPKTAFWWLDYYGDFREHLLTCYKVAHRDESCVVFDLRQSPNRERNR